MLGSIRIVFCSVSIRRVRGANLVESPFLFVDGCRRMHYLEYPSADHYVCHILELGI